MKRFQNKQIDILVDADGTVFTHEYPRVGRDIGAVPVLQELVKNGHRLIIFTMRDGKELQDVVDWYAKNNIPLFGIQSNPEQKRWTTSPKAYGQYIIDDICAFAPLKKEKPYDKPFIDWVLMRQELVNVGLIKE